MLWPGRCRPFDGASDDVDARGDALYGAWLCGAVLGNVGMALHHKLCHTLGGSFNLPHAEVHTVILPHAIDFNAPATPEAMTRIQRALGTTGRSSAAAGLFDLARDNGVPVALRDISAAQRADIRQLLQDAYEGVRPH